MPERALITRNFKEADLPQLQALWKRGVVESPTAFGVNIAEVAQWNDERWRRMLLDPWTFGCFAGDELAGFLCGFRAPAHRKQHAVGIGPLYVAEHMRRHGVARHMMGDFIAKLPEGVEEVRLGVTKGNAPAERFYESMGFVAWGTEPNAMKLEDGSYVDAIWLRLPLAA